MSRVALETLALFLTPFALFGLYLVLRLQFPLTLEPWTRARVSWLTLIGLAAALGGLIVLEVVAPRGYGVYVPAHVVNGVLVPGQFQ